MSRHHSNPIGNKSGACGSMADLGPQAAAIPAIALLGIVFSHMHGGHRSDEGVRCGDNNMSEGCDPGKPRAGSSWGGDSKPPGC